MTDLKDALLASSIEAFNQGLQVTYGQGRELGIKEALEKFLDAARFVSFENDKGVQILALSDLIEELESRFDTPKQTN